MSGANNIPLGARPPGGGTTFGKAPPGPSGGSSLLNPSYLAGGGPPAPKRPNMDLIAKLNSKMGHNPGSAPPPMVAPGMMAGGGPPMGGGMDSVADDVAAAAAAARAAAQKIAAQLGTTSGSGDGPAGETKEERRARKRKSRWGGSDGTDKTFIPGLPTMLPSGLTQDQEEAYLLQLKIEDASRRLRMGDYGIPPNPEDRSPSPEPIYSSDGKRMNTREYRKRKELEETRHKSTQKLMAINSDYKPPPDYKPPQIKVNDKVMIPQDDHPEINFVGLLIGPRGNTLKSMEKETGAKIIIRGKGSVKEGKVGRKDGQPLPGEDEPLHAYVTATDPEAVKRAVNKIKEVIQQGVEVPEGSNELRKMQLRELALLNGTLREDGQVRCTNCGAADHKTWQCQDKANVTNNVVCTSCGAVGHIAGDCKQRRCGASFGGQYGEGGGAGNNKIDEEYLSFMAELGDGNPAPPGAGPAGGGGGARAGGGMGSHGARQALPAPASSGSWGGWGGQSG